MCQELGETVKQHQLQQLNPYTKYRVSVKAYTNGKVRREGSCEVCDVKTNESSKLYALFFCPVKGKERSMNF